MIQKVGGGDMYYVFNKSVVGYSHLKSNKPCQDYSASYKDNERIIITCCDGHGGNQYIRSQTGSKLASEAVMNVFKQINRKFLNEKEEIKLINKIKLFILLEYNKLVERDIANEPIRKKELEGLNEEEIDTLTFKKEKAYGTTLTGALLYKNKYYVVTIGDTEALGFKKGQLIKLFNNDDDPAGNITYSMCQEDAYQYLKVAIIDEKKLDGILLCTDGLSSPYQSYENFHESFIKNAIKNIIKTKSLTYLNDFIDEIGSNKGVGDDVSLSLIVSRKTSINNY